MSSVAEYLQSEEAVADLTHHFSFSDDEHKQTSDDWFGRDDAWQWHSRQSGAWREMRFNHGVSVYYRPEGDRYVVTDLGEAVRALRLRTGRGPLMGCDQQHLFSAVPDDPMVMACGDTALWGYGGDVESLTVRAADLPRAIVRVMLAAYRVASLEISPTPICEHDPYRFWVA